MKVRAVLKNTLGFSLVEVMLAAGLGSIVLAGMSQALVLGYQGQRGLKSSANFNNFVSFVNVSLNSQLGCNSSLFNKNLAPIPAAPLVVGSLGTGTALNTLFMVDGTTPLATAGSNYAYDNTLTNLRFALYDGGQLTTGAPPFIHIAILYIEAQKAPGTYLGPGKAYSNIYFPVGADAGGNIISCTQGVTTHAPSIQNYAVTGGPGASGTWTITRYGSQTLAVAVPNPGTVDVAIGTGTIINPANSNTKQRYIFSSWINPPIIWPAFVMNSSNWSMSLSYQQSDGFGRDYGNEIAAIHYNMTGFNTASIWYERSNTSDKFSTGSLAGWSAIAYKIW